LCRCSDGRPRPSGGSTHTNQPLLVF
jgi:hypothetical protein